jgi:NAD+ synthase
VEAIRTALPAYGPGWRCKLSLPPITEESRLNVTVLVAESPDGTRRTARLSASAYLQLLAATNFKQRVRATMAYYHADRRHFAVAGTPNLLEYDQGFFVKHGDGAADLKPIAHLYKTQVYALAEHLGVPDEIRRRPPTTETFSLPQTQEEFFFAVPYDQLDLCLYALNHHVPSDEVAQALGVSPEKVERVFRDIEGKRRATRYLHAPPLLIDETEDD